MKRLTGWAEREKAPSCGDVYAAQDNLGTESTEILRTCEKKEHVHGGGNTSDGRTSRGLGAKKTIADLVVAGRSEAEYRLKPKRAAHVDRTESTSRA